MEGTVRGNFLFFTLLLGANSLTGKNLFTLDEQILSCKCTVSGSESKLKPVECRSSC